LDPYLSEWLNLILRFTHLVTGIAWIGASFYFVWLDNHLQNPPPHKQQQGIKGDLWAIHGGGFYEVAKYQLAPPVMPKTLHWFKWEAYSTWISGMLLLFLVYYVGAASYLIDPQVKVWLPWQASLLGVSFILFGWLAYEGLCATSLKKNGLLLGLALLLLGAVLSYALTQVFSARGAYIHMGVIIGTIMVGNVFKGIMPAQRALVAAVQKGEQPDPGYAENAKLRSTHNTYTTLPLLFIMISNHYPMTYGHQMNWLVLVVLMVCTAAIRQYFVLRHFNRQHWAWLAAAFVGIVLLAWSIRPQLPEPNLSQAVNSGNTVQEQVIIDKQKLQAIIQQRCATCHSATPTDDIFKIAPAGVVLDNWQQMQQWRPRILVRTVQSKDMPFINKTQMTDEERAYLGLWGQ